MHILGDIPLVGTMPSLVNGVVIILVWAFFFVSTSRAGGVGYATRLACVLLGGVTTVTALVWLVLEKTWKPFGGGTAIGVYVAGWALIVLIGLAIGSYCARGQTRLVPWFKRRRATGPRSSKPRASFSQRWASIRWKSVARVVGACAAFVCGTVACVNVVNNSFALYPSVDSLVGKEPYTTAQYADVKGTSTSFTPPQGSTIAGAWNGVSPRKKGVLVPFMIPSPVSHFQTTESQVYLPPAYFANPRPLLPVVVLMNGLPGSPSQWFEIGNAGQTLHHFERVHHGLAPVVVAINTTGNDDEDLGCFDTRKAKVQTYMDTDVPQQIQKYFQVSNDPTQWAIGGLSYGGTCALQAIVNNPEPYRYFLDFSGDRTPGTMSAKGNADTYFGGNLNAYLRVNPEDILKRRKFTGIKGVFVAGQSDKSSVRDLKYMNGLAQSAGIDSSFREVPGGHDFGTWRLALVLTLPDVARATRLIG